MTGPGRPENPLETGSGPLADLASELRHMRELRGLTFRELSEKTGRSPSTLTAAASGKKLASWQVIHDWVQACGGDESTLRGLYGRACEETGRPAPGPDLSGGEPPDPATASTAADFLDQMRRLRVWAGDPSLSMLNKHSGGNLPPSTISEILRRDSLPRRRDLIADYVRACYHVHGGDMPDDAVEQAVRKWESTWNDIKSDQSRLAHAEGGTRRRPHLAVRAAPVLSAISVVLIVITAALLVSNFPDRPGAGPPIPSPRMSSEPTICGTGWVRFIGSDDFVPIAQDAANAYMLDCPDAAITVTGGDSASGLTELLDAVTSGSSSAGSIIAMYDGTSTDTAGLSTYPAGVLIFSVVAHTGLFPAGNITTSELRKIFAKPGEQGMAAVGRRAGDGSRQAFITKVLGLNPNTLVPDKSSCPVPTGNRDSFTSCTEDSNADLLSFVNGTPNAIGYAEVFRPPAGYPQASVLSIDNVLPTRENVLNGSYKFWNAVHLYAAMHPAPLTKDFLDFLPHFIESNPPSNFIACSPALKRSGADC